MKNQDIIFGRRPVIESLKSGKTIEKIFIQKNISNELISLVKEFSKEKKINISVVPKEKLNRMTRKNHQGIICVTSTISYQPIDEIVHRCYESGKDPLILILDRITDTRNFGAITRVAEASQVDAIVVPEKETALISSDAVKSSAGAINYIPICKSNKLVDDVNKLKESGLKIFSCSEKGEEDIYSVNLNIPACIILGSEKDGISNSLLESSDKIIKIPMFGKVSSLNVATSSAVILFESVRQRN